jgi:A/G-specific adenine glycosylase
MANQASPSPRASLLAMPAASQIQRFRKIVWSYWEKEGRHGLPWRQPSNRGQTHDPYKVLVSEMMLQQTQVDRVIPFYKNFLKKFPNVRALAKAPLREVLIAWQGLGYNRRAKMLHSTAKEVVEKYKGKFPESVEELESLPGIGHYTSRAIAAFAYNQPGVFIETNLRTVITHHFFADQDQVDDTEILKILSKAYPKPTAERGSREWYAALMDYGSYLKRSGVRINSKSKTYTKQSKFAGSDREARGAILKALSEGPITRVRILRLLGLTRKTQLDAQLKKLMSEKLITKARKYYTLG